MALFLREDYDGLLDEINRLSEKIRSIGLVMADGASQDAGNAIHDNPSYEEGHRQLRMWTRHLADLIRLRDQAQLVQKPTSTQRVEIGSTVTVMDLDELTTLTYQIGSFQNFRPASSRPQHEQMVVSYPAPLAKMLLGAKVDDRRTAIIAGKPKSLRVLRIE